jgi:hypothetical protein
MKNGDGDRQMGIKTEERQWEGTESGRRGVRCQEERGKEKNVPSLEENTNFKVLSSKINN